jgi:two-component system sensor histidine kinase SaeS
MMNLSRLPMGFWLAMVVPLAYALAMLIIIPDLQPPLEDLALLTAYMGASGYGTVLGVVALLRLRFFQRFGSLRWALLITSMLAVFLIFINVFVTVRLMYISHHDFVLTVALLVYAGLITLVCISAVAHHLIERMKRLSEAADRLTRQDFSTRLEVRGSDELAQVEELFNQAVNALASVEMRKQALEQSRRELIAWISHDLKTPLAAIRAMNEAMLDGVVDDAESMARYHRSIQREVEHVAYLIEDLVQLAAVDAGELVLKRQPTLLHSLVEDVLAQISGQAAQWGVEMCADLPNHLPLLDIASDKIRRVLYNLLDNALQHTPPSGQVRLCAWIEGEWAWLTVHNSGSYIPPHELERIFERFYRGEQARSARQGQRGTGLGLAIARTFVEVHGGKIRASSHPQDGTTFTLSLPLLAVEG